MAVFVDARFECSFLTGSFRERDRGSEVPVLKHAGRSRSRRKGNRAQIPSGIEHEQDESIMSPLLDV
jgi:hypothetical protein